MFFPKDTNFFERDDDELLNFRFDEYPRASKVSVAKELTLKPQKDETVRMGKISNALTFLQKFDFQPRPDINTDTPLEVFVKDVDKLQTKSTDSSSFKIPLTDLAITDSSNNSTLCDYRKDDPAFPTDDISFDVFFDDDDDFIKSIDLHEKDELKLRENCEVSDDLELSDESTKLSPKELVDFYPRHSTLLTECKKKSFSNDENHLLLSNPCTSGQWFESSLHQNEKIVASSTNNLEFDAVNLKSPVPTTSTECKKKSLNNNENRLVLPMPCTSSQWLESFLHPNKKTVASSTNNSGFDAVNLNSPMPTTSTECKKKSLNDNENRLVLSNPCTSSQWLESLLHQNTKTVASSIDNLVFDAANLKSPVPTTSTALARLTTSYSVHKARKRKFPGPAGLLPEPPRSPSVLKLHETSVEFNTSENLSDQETLCSQSNGEDFLLPPWSNMMKDLASHSNLTLLKRFNIKSVRRQASRKKLPKYVEVPFFCVLLKSFMLKDSEVITIFKDETGEISGKIHQEVINKYKDSLKVGAILVLRKATFLLDQLGIRLANIIRIYDSNGNKICVNDWNDIPAIAHKNQISRCNSEPPRSYNESSDSVKQHNKSQNKDVSQDYVVDFEDDSLFEDDLNDIVSTLDESSFMV